MFLYMVLPSRSIAILVLSVGSLADQELRGIPGALERSPKSAVLTVRLSQLALCLTLHKIRYVLGFFA